MDRILPARKDRPVAFELPQLTTAADGVKATTAIVAAVAAGGSHTERGGRKAVEAADLEKRLTKLEQAAGR